MKRRLSRLSSFLLVALLASCVEFEQQTLSYRYDKATDTLRIFQDYHGVFGADAHSKPEKGLSEQEQEQLTSVLKGQRTFFFNNWIFELNRAQHEEQLKELKDPEKRATWKLPEAGLASAEKLLKLLVENVRVENGPFYLNSGKKLCGVQYVTITKCSEVIAAACQYAPHFIQSQADEEGASAEDKASRREFASRPRPVIELDGNSVTLRWPMSRQSYEEEYGSLAKDAARLAERRKAGLTTAFAGNIATWKLGQRTDSVTRLTLSFSKNAYLENLVQPARNQHVVLEKFDVKAAEEDFLLRNRKASLVKK